MLRFFTYKSCDSCRKARMWLRENGVDFEEIPIRETPPSFDELDRARKRLGLKRLFNTAGLDYRQLGLKDRIPSMSEKEAISLLSQNGNLVKRPFLVGETVVLTGFRPEEWSEVLLD